MKKFAVILVIAALAFSNAVAQTNDFSDEVLVKFLPGTVQLDAVNGAEKASLSDVQFSSSTIGKILQNNGAITIAVSFPNIRSSDTLYTAEDGTKIKLFDISNIYTIKLADKTKRNGLIAQLSKQPEVVYAEPNGIAMPCVTPVDPYYQLQWGLNQPSGCDIDAPEAWDIYKGSSTIKIGIIDGGVENWHEDLSGKVSGDVGWGWSGHGFHVAGIAAAKTNNATGVAGVDWNAQIISQRIDNTDYAGTHQAIMDAVNSGAQVLNNSWVMRDYWGDPVYSITVRGAFANAYKLNRVAVAAMGNSNINHPYYPAGYGQGIIAVGATDRYDVRSPWSNTGNHIDVVAPGGIHADPTAVNQDDIYSSYCKTDTLYRYLGGTSMAAPFVTGLASLLKGYNGSLSNDDIEQIIRLSADKVSGMGGAWWHQEYGTGRINARKALEMLGPGYCLNQWSASGGAIVGSPSYMYMTFVSVPGLSGGWYPAYRYEIRKTISFPTSFNIVPTVWGRGVGSNGYNDGDDNVFIYDLPFTEVVPGTVTKTGCQLRTYLYKVRRSGGITPDYVWVPFENPASAVFQYTAFIPYTAPSIASISGYYEPYAGAKMPAGYINLSWDCQQGTIQSRYTIQIKDPYTTGSWVDLIVNTTATSYRHQRLPSYGGTGYRVIVNDGRTALTSNACVIYPPVPGDPIISPSFNTDATAFSNGKKLAIDDDGKLHVTYTSRDTVFYATSADDGETWSGFTPVGFGTNPAIELRTATAKGASTTSQIPSICYASGNSLYLAEKSGTGSWNQPLGVYQGQPDEEISYLSYVLNRQNNQAYVGWVSTTPSGSNVYSAPYTPGSGGGQLAPIIVDPGGGSTLFKSPSLAIARDGGLITAWSRDGLVKYSDPVEGTIELSATDKYSIHPIVSTYGDRTSVTWMEQTSSAAKNELGKYQIVARERTTSGWSEPHVISFPDSGDAQFPVSAAYGQYIYTKETGDGNYDINSYGNYANNWETHVQNISHNSGGQSYYPDVIFRPSWPSHKLYIVWSEKDTQQTKAMIAPVNVKIYVKTIEPVPTYGVNPNADAPTPYTTQRAGAFCFGSGQHQTVDYHPEKLAYHFDNLDPKMKYQVKAVYYWTSSRSGKSGHRDDWRQMLKADQTTLANTWVPETTVVKEIKLIPKHCYRDGQVDISIERKAGDYAICAGLELIAYEDEKVGHGGGQMEAESTLPLAYQFKLMQSVPNPSTGKTMIGYQIAAESQVSLNIYNTLGQVVKTLMDEVKQPGAYQAIWNGKDNAGKTVAAGIYFYRLIAGDKTDIKKMVVIR